MSSVQAELLRIGGVIAQTEFVAMHENTGSSKGASWTNVNDFKPGLAIQATYTGVRQFGLENLVSVDMLSIDVAQSAVASIHVSTNPEHERDYENNYARYILRCFMQYERRKNPLIPAGISGYAKITPGIGPGWVIKIEPITT